MQIASEFDLMMIDGDYYAFPNQLHHSRLGYAIKGRRYDVVVVVVDRQLDRDDEAEVLVRSMTSPRWWSANLSRRRRQIASMLCTLAPK